MTTLVQTIGCWISPTRFPAPPKEDYDHPMKAVVVRGHGNPEVLEYADFPSPLPVEGTKQVLIDVVAASVNPVDFKLRKEDLVQFMYPLPEVPGADVAGIVSYAPPDSSLKKGDRVYGMMPLLSATYGSYAEKAVVDEAILSIAPDNHSLVDLASIPLVATTVVQALRPVKAAYHDGIVGKKCLIPCGSGGLGTFAIQYCAKELGMFVATSCSPKNFELVKSLGASEVYDYKTEKMEEKIIDYDVVLDSMGYQNEELILNSTSRILKPSTSENPSFYLRIASSPYGKGNSLISGDPLHLAIPEARFDRVLTSYSKEFLSQFSLLPNGIRYHFVLVYSEKEALDEVSEAIRKGTIRPVVAERLPLNEAIKAHQLIEDGHTNGKIVLVVNEKLERK
jgi:alcohol dehydrogenase